jgi:phosphatidyl-myo-inositol dimannoside synthase
MPTGSASWRRQTGAAERAPASSVLTLFTSLFDSTGGIQTFNRSLVQALAEIAEGRGGNVNALVLMDRGDSALAARHLAPERTRYTGFSGSRIRFAAASLRAAREADDIFIGHVNFAPLALAFRFLRPTARIFLPVHGIDVWKRLSGPVRAGVDRCDRILSVSAFTRDCMIRFNRMPAGRFSILPCTLDARYDVRARNTTARPALPNGRILLSVSRLDASEQRKGIDDVISAMPELLRRHPDVHYVVAGDGADRTRLERLAVELGVAGRVVFAGRVGDDELPAYYDACELFVLPSTKEGFGIVFLEAMYHGKACVGSRAGGAPEVVAHGESGYLAEPDDVASLTEALSLLLADPERCRRMGQAGKRRLEDHFSPSRFRQRVEAIVSS